jgi:hypothetical protein
MKYKFVWMHDGDCCYAKEISGLIPLETRCSFRLVYKDEIDIWIFLTAYEYYYNFEQDVIEIRFGETDNEEGFEIEYKDIVKIMTILDSDDFDPTELKITSRDTYPTFY